MEVKYFEQEEDGDVEVLKFLVACIRDESPQTFHPLFSMLTLLLMCENSSQ